MADGRGPDMFAVDSLYSKRLNTTHRRGIRCKCRWGEYRHHL